MGLHPPPENTHWEKGTIFIVGHLTLLAEQFIDLLKTYGIGQLADIRTVPVRDTTPSSTPMR